jgi:hypothetical protein
MIPTQRTLQLARPRKLAFTCRLFKRYKQRKQSIKRRKSIDDVANYLTSSSGVEFDLHLFAIGDHLALALPSLIQRLGLYCCFALLQRKPDFFVSSTCS